MAQTLIFRFLTAEQLEWWLAGAKAPERGSPAELAAQAAGQRLLLAVPGEAVFLTRATVPGRNRTTWLKAIPYALEDGLAEDVEDLHFAIANATTGTEIPVAVVSHEILSAWMSACNQAGIHPAAVVPDLLLLPYQEDAWSVLVEEQRALVRIGRWDGFATDLEELGLLLDLAMAEASEQPPQYLRLWGEVTPQLAELGIEIRCQDPHPEPLKLFADYDSNAAINLLQGPYSRQAHLGKWLRPWRLAAALAGLYLGVQVAMQVSEYWQLSQEQAALRTEMVRVYQEAVPEARKIVNPRAQLENHLRELRRGDAGAQAVFLDLLYRGGQPLVAAKGVTLQGLRYKNNQLDLDLEGSSPEVLDQLKQRFNAHPDLEVQMRTTKRDDKVRSQVTFKRAAS